MTNSNRTLSDTESTSSPVELGTIRGPMPPMHGSRPRMARKVPLVGHSEMSFLG